MLSQIADDELKLLRDWIDYAEKCIPYPPVVDQLLPLLGEELTQRQRGRKGGDNLTRASVILELCPDVPRLSKAIQLLIDEIRDIRHD